MATVFFSYSHIDESLRDQLEVQLTMLRREGLIETWHDRRIVAGQNLDSSILDSLGEADIVLLLVSPDFLASEYCWSVEVRYAMQRHEAGEAAVIPVILRPSDWRNAPFGGLLAVPKDGKPVTLWPDRDDAFLDIVRMIRSALRARTARRSSVVNGDRYVDTAPVVTHARSSNLRISKSFTDADRDRFLYEGYEYIANFFDASLQALEERNDTIRVAFRRIDANRFVGTSYRNRGKQAGCTVWVGTDPLSSGIRFSRNDSGATGSYNEELSVDNDDQILYFQAIMMGVSQRKLSLQGAAEHLWQLFMEPMQGNHRN